MSHMFTSPFNVTYRFANGFGADARRKRHTADSGYGSEQPLDRRWSQDFSQDVSTINRLSLNINVTYPIANVNLINVFE